MLSEEAMEKLSERLVTRIENMNTYMLKQIGAQIATIGTMTPTQAYELLQSVKYGNDIDKIAKAIAQMNNMNVEDVYSIFEEVANTATNYAEPFFKYRNIQFIPYAENKSLQEQVRALATITANEYLNIARTSAYGIIKASGAIEYTDLSKIYQSITDEAVINISQGREGYMQAMNRATKDMVRSGIQTMEYASGTHRRLDTAVRTNILEGARQLSQTLMMQFGEQFNYDGVQISHHKNPAPDHSQEYAEKGWHDVDGQQFTLEEFQDMQGEVRTTENYYTVKETKKITPLARGIGKLNCYHFAMPIIMGVTKNQYSEEELQRDKRENEKGFMFEGKHYTNYEGTQLQRQIETNIRHLKDHKAYLSATGQEDLERRVDGKIQAQAIRYQNLSEESLLPTRIERLKTINKYNVRPDPDITNPSIMRTAKVEYADITKEWMGEKGSYKNTIKFYQPGEELERQAEYSFRRIDWVEEIIIKKNDTIKVYKRNQKKRSDYR